MKKFFTLIAAVAMAASMNAQTNEWNFSDWDAQNYDETFVKDGLTLYVGSDSKGKVANFVIDESNKTIDGAKYTKRLKTGGKGDFNKDNTPHYRIVDFSVSGPVDIYVALATSNKTDPKKLTIYSLEADASELSEVGVISLDANQIKGETVKYTGKAGKIYLSPDGGINIYDIKVTSSTLTSITSITTPSSEKESAVYNLAGQQVNKDYKGVVIQNGKKFLNK